MNIGFVINFYNNLFHFKCIAIAVRDRLQASLLVKLWNWKEDGKGREKVPLIS